MANRDFVVIEKNKYTFYQGNRKVVSVNSDEMTAKWLEFYRTHHDAIFKSIVNEPPPESA